MSTLPPYQPQVPTTEPRYVEPHPQMRQQPGNGYMVPPAHHSPVYGPPVRQHPTGGRIAMFVIALALSVISWLFGVAGLLPGSSANAEPVPYIMLGYGVVTVGFSAFCIYRACKTQLRYLWSILLLVTNVVLPTVPFVLFLVLFAGAAMTDIGPHGKLVM